MQKFESGGPLFPFDVQDCEPGPGQSYVRASCALWSLAGLLYLIASVSYHRSLPHSQSGDAVAPTDEEALTGRHNFYSTTYDASCEVDGMFISNGSI